MTKKQRKAVIEILLCAADPESSSGIMDPRNGGKGIDVDLRERLVQARIAIAGEEWWWADRNAYTLSCLELAQRVTDEEWP